MRQFILDEIIMQNRQHDEANHSKEECAPHDQDCLSTSLHAITDTAHIAHMSGVHLPGPLKYVGTFTEIVSEIYHHPAGELSEKIVCGTGIGLLKEGINTAIAIEAAKIAGSASSLAVTPVGGAIVGATAGVIAYKTSQAITEPVAQHFQAVCHETFENINLPLITEPTTPQGIEIQTRQAEIARQQEEAAARQVEAARQAEVVQKTIPVITTAIQPQKTVPVATPTQKPVVTTTAPTPAPVVPTTQKPVVTTTASTPAPKAATPALTPKGETPALKPVVTTTAPTLTPKGETPALVPKGAIPALKPVVTTTAPTLTPKGATPALVPAPKAATPAPVPAPKAAAPALVPAPKAATPAPVPAPKAAAPALVPAPKAAAPTAPPAKKQLTALQIKQAANLERRQIKKAKHLEHKKIRHEQAATYRASPEGQQALAKKQAKAEKRARDKQAVCSALQAKSQSDFIAGCAAMRASEAARKHSDEVTRQIQQETKERHDRADRESKQNSDAFNKAFKPRRKVEDDFYIRYLKTQALINNRNGNPSSPSGGGMFSSPSTPNQSVSGHGNKNCASTWDDVASGIPICISK